MFLVRDWSLEESNGSGGVESLFLSRRCCEGVNEGSLTRYSHSTSLEDRGVKHTSISTALRSSTAVVGNTEGARSRDKEEFDFSCDGGISLKALYSFTGEV